MIVKCACLTCNQTIEVSYPLNIGEFSDSSGWKFLFVEDQTHFLCPSHKAEVEKLAEKILAITGTKSVFFPSLLKRKS